MRQDPCRDTADYEHHGNPSARLLRLLVLLQSRPRWTGGELRDRLEVSARTLRYDVRKLRDLGYLVHAASGTGGGYTLRPGASLPPLQLEDEEAVAIAIGLRAAAGTVGVGESAATALLKLEQVMPWRLRGRVNAVLTFSTTVGPSGPATDADAVVFLTGACRDQRRVRFEYTARDGSTSRREVEPYRLVQMGRRWYLQAFDPSRDDWRSFRLDRMRLTRPEGARFAAREPPPVSSLEASADAFYARHRAVVLIASPADRVGDRLPAHVPVKPVDSDRSRVHATGETPRAVAVNLLLLDEAFTILESSPGVLDALRTLADRITAAIADQDGDPMPADRLAN